MKGVRLVIWIVLIAFVSLPVAHAQEMAGEDSTGLPGDNFSLQGALEMFKKAGSPEEFERLINTENNNVNNLDLNGDGQIDYIRVIDKADKNIHAFVLQVPVTEKESQDIAVIELERTGNTSAVLQIVGDEDIYGEQMIVEPQQEVEAPEEGGGGYNGPHVDVPVAEPMYAPGVVINVWLWPSVRYVYGPGYKLWVSPWRWRHYPGWWHPWHPMLWRAYHPLRARYRTGFAVVRTHRVIRANRIYRSVRVTSVTVRNRHGAAVQRYRVTRTTSIKARPGGAKVRTTRKATRVAPKAAPKKPARGGRKRH
jgi:hypothetical protein